MFASGRTGGFPAKMFIIALEASKVFSGARTDGDTLKEEKNGFCWKSAETIATIHNHYLTAVQVLADWSRGSQC
jgi:hypothetical protein